MTDELRRLLKEFETELAILKGRVDGLEARVGELKGNSSPPPPSSVARVTGWLVRHAPKGDNYETGEEKGAALQR